MESSRQLERSPELMSRHDTALLVVDVQGKLANAVQHPTRLVWNIQRLIQGAQLLGLPVAATEQYPEGLGPTIPQLAEMLTDISSKRMFSCGENGDIFANWSKAGIPKILVCGIEAHVCIQQTTLDLLAEGFRVYLPCDGISSRQEFDAKIAIRRMEASGATITSTEAALFEWCATSKCSEFKSISQLVQQSPPTGES